MILSSYVIGMRDHDIVNLSGPYMKPIVQDLSAWGVEVRRFTASVHICVCQSFSQGFRLSDSCCRAAAVIDKDRALCKKAFTSKELTSGPWVSAGSGAWERLPLSSITLVRKVAALTSQVSQVEDSPMVQRARCGLSQE